MIHLIQGEADTLFAIRSLRGQWIDGKSLSLMMYPGKNYEEYFNRCRKRLRVLASMGLVDVRHGKNNNNPTLYTVTDAGTFDPIHITKTHASKKESANAFRAQSMAAYHERKRMEKEAEGETADDRWAAMPPVRVRVDAASAPRVSHAALRHASVFAWAGQ